MSLFRMVLQLGIPPLQAAQYQLPDLDGQLVLDQEVPSLALGIL